MRPQHWSGREARESAQSQGGDSLPDLAAAKSLLLLTDASWTERFAPVREVIELFDDGKPEHGDSLAHDGVFSARLGRVPIPGLISVEVSASGQSAQSRQFARRFVASASVKNALFSPSRSHVRAFLEPGIGSPWTVRAQATPRDIEGNYLGPGYRDLLRFIMPGATATSAVVDELDGSYTQTFTVPALTAASGLTLEVDGQRLVDTTLAKAIGTRLAVWFLLLVVLALLLVAFVLLLRAKIFGR